MPPLVLKKSCGRVLPPLTVAFIFEANRGFGKYSSLPLWMPKFGDDGYVNRVMEYVFESHSRRDGEAE